MINRCTVSCIWWQPGKTFVMFVMYLLTGVERWCSRHRWVCCPFPGHGCRSQSWCYFLSIMFPRTQPAVTKRFSCMSAACWCNWNISESPPVMNPQLHLWHTDACWSSLPRQHVRLFVLQFQQSDWAERILILRVSIFNDLSSRPHQSSVVREEARLSVSACLVFCPCDALNLFPHHLSTKRYEITFFSSSQQMILSASHYLSRSVSY